MGLVIREAVGWILAVVGLILIFFILRLALNRSVLEAMALSLPATIVFRAGIGLVKVAAAGRIAARLTEEDRPQRRREGAS